MKNEIINIENQINEIEKLINKNFKKIHSYENQSYAKVKDKIKLLENENNSYKNKLLILNKKLDLLKNKFNKTIEFKNNLKNNDVQLVECIVEKSCSIRFGCDIEYKIIFDITNNKSLNNVIYNSIEEIFERYENFSDYESATELEKMFCIKIGKKYYIETN